MIVSGNTRRSRTAFAYISGTFLVILGNAPYFLSQIPQKKTISVVDFSETHPVELREKRERPNRGLSSAQNESADSKIESLPPMADLLVMQDPNCRLDELNRAGEIVDKGNELRDYVYRQRGPSFTRLKSNRSPGISNCVLDYQRLDVPDQHSVALQVFDSRTMLPSAARPAKIFVLGLPTFQIVPTNAHQPIAINGWGLTQEQATIFNLPSPPSNPGEDEASKVVELSNAVMLAINFGADIILVKDLDGFKKVKTAARYAEQSGVRIMALAKTGLSSAFVTSSFRREAEQQR